MRDIYLFTRMYIMCVFVRDREMGFFTNIIVVLLKTIFKTKIGRT